MTGGVLFVGAAAAVGWLASRGGRNPVAWALLALLASGVTSALAVALSGDLLQRSESAALAAVVLAPLLGLVAVVAVGVFAAQPLPRAVEVAPAVEAAPEEGIAMVHLSNEGAAHDAGAPYRAEARCRLVLGARMLTVEGATPARTSLAYRLVAATAVDDDVLRLAWTNRHGDGVALLLRPADGDAPARAEVVRDVVRRVTTRHEDQGRG
ncbi:MAG: hypothetical protein JWM10_4731 [Myxococcaceae bacterium]|nr:hypothetical protein [Myxococcaceae bacterium]